MRKGRQGEKNRGGGGSEKKEKNDENSGHYIIAAGTPHARANNCYFGRLLSRLTPAVSGKIFGSKYWLPRRKIFYPTLDTAHTLLMGETIGVGTTHNIERSI